MRKFIPVTLAIAIVAVAAVAILTSSEALSFSDISINNPVGNEMPPNQSQPQDFAGAGSQFYYFGPDFMCQIFLDTTISCYGSNANGVVSNTPNITGFSNVDGGDTYACAFHQATRFNYCWGAITRRPTTIQPTIAPTIQPTTPPTVEPTPTEVVGTAVPTVVPTITPTIIPTVEPTPVPSPCRIAMPAGGTLPATITGSWIENCVYPIEIDDAEAGDHYYRYVRFRVNTASSPWVATLSSSEDTYMLLWEIDAATDEWTLIDENDDLADDNTNSRITWTPTIGTSYVLDLTTYKANTLGDFTLTIKKSATDSQGLSSDQSMEYSDSPNTIPLERRQ